MKLPVVSGKEAIKAPEKANFKVVRQKGSHVRMEKKREKGTTTTIKLTVPLHKTLKKGTLKAILKIAELTTEEFRELL